jgi:hypothetical protein
MSKKEFLFCLIYLTMKSVIYFSKLAGFMVLCFLCLFFFFDLFVLVGFNEGITTIQVAGVLLSLLLIVGIVYKKSNLFNSFFEPLRR